MIHNLIDDVTDHGGNWRVGVEGVWEFNLSRTTQTSFKMPAKNLGYRTLTLPSREHRQGVDNSDCYGNRQGTGRRNKKYEHTFVWICPLFYVKLVPEYCCEWTYTVVYVVSLLVTRNCWATASTLLIRQRIHILPPRPNIDLWCFVTTCVTEWLPWLPVKTY